MSQLDSLFFGDDESDEENNGAAGVGAARKRGLDGKEKQSGGNEGTGGAGDGEGDGDGDVQLKTDEVDVELKKKLRKKPRPFNEDVLTTRDGLTRIYEEFPNSCRFRGRGKEAEDLKALLSMYKEWGFQLYPNLALPDLLARCDTLGGKGKVRGQLEQLRDRERSRYLNEVLHVPLAEIRVRVLADSGHGHRGSPRDLTSPEASSPSAGDIAGELLASPVGGSGGLSSPAGRGRAPVEPVSLWSEDLWDDALMADVERIEREARESAAAAASAVPHAAEGGEEAEDLPISEEDLFVFDGDAAADLASVGAPGAAAAAAPEDAPASTMPAAPSSSSSSSSSSSTSSTSSTSSSSSSSSSSSASAEASVASVLAGPGVERETEMGAAEDSALHPESRADAAEDLSGSEPETQPQVMEVDGPGKAPEVEIELEASDSEEDE